jgi:PAS domain S-box-containing protein
MRALPFSELAMRIIENAADAVIYADREGVIRLWNMGATRILGYPASEAEGRSLDIIVPEPQRARHWSGYRRVMESGESRYATDLLQVPGIRKDGTKVSLEFTVVLVHDDNGKVSGIAAIMRDVTLRWQREQAARKRLAELEAQLGKNV